MTFVGAHTYFWAIDPDMADPPHREFIAGCACGWRAPGSFLSASRAQEAGRNHQRLSPRLVAWVKVCGCGREFLCHANNRAKYCGPECRLEARRKQKREWMQVHSYNAIRYGRIKGNKVTEEIKQATVFNPEWQQRRAEFIRARDLVRKIRASGL